MVVDKEIWSSLNNIQTVSVNLLCQSDVENKEYFGKTLIFIRIPRAPRKSRPVYKGSNPFTGTYKRDYEGDFLCDSDTVKRMLSEQIDENRDIRVIHGFVENDINFSSVTIYRQLFRTLKPTHIWNTLPNTDFLIKIGAMGYDRDNGNVYLTAAGLLLFGEWRSIQEEFPNYLVDYREVNIGDSNERWIDRVYPDGSWSGNLFDFFQIVIKKLYSGIKVPFKLEGANRIDDSPVHEAIREALVNTLIHADYSGRIGVLIIKKTNSFEFRNPGNMRVPLEDALRGGQSDCRNRTLQAMFDFIGYGERAGSGLPTIYQNWKSQLWRAPELKENFKRDFTQLNLRMENLLPDDVIKGLESRFGKSFDDLSTNQKISLATASIEGLVTHARIKEISDLHSSDISKELRELVKFGFLVSNGVGRAVNYTLGTPKPSEQQTLDHLITQGSGISPSDYYYSDPIVTGDNSTNTDKSSTNNKDNSTNNKDNSTNYFEKKDRIDKLLRGNKRSDPEIMQKVILIACEDNYLTIKEIHHLTGRSPNTIRNYLKFLREKNLIELKFPEKISNPKQGYRKRNE